MFVWLTCIIHYVFPCVPVDTTVRTVLLASHFVEDSYTLFSCMYCILITYNECNCPIYTTVCNIDYIRYTCAMSCDTHTCCCCFCFLLSVLYMLVFTCVYSYVMLHSTLASQEDNHLKMFFVYRQPMRLILPLLSTPISLHLPPPSALLHS